MFLSGEWLEANGSQYITPFDRSQIDCAAYSLRVGQEAYVSPESTGAHSSPILRLGPKEPICIPPGQFAFLITSEFVRIPFDLIAFINIRFSLKVQGLVNVSGFHVDPGYQGRLIFSVFNAGPKTLYLREGDEAFLIWFARLEQPSERYAKTGVGHMQISSDLVSRVPFQGTSLNSLNARLDRLETSLGNLKWVLGIVAVGFAISAGGSFLGAWLLELVKGVTGG